MLPKEPTLHISKLDAAKRQLETAVLLFFNSSDPVSIHTLATAAYGILYDINKHRGGAPMVKDGDCIREDVRAMVIKKLLEAQNFFKHADRDPLASVEFSPAITEAFLAEAVTKYCELTSEKAPYLHVFSIWVRAWRPQFFFMTLEEEKSGEFFRTHYPVDAKLKFFTETIAALAAMPTGLTQK